MKAFWLIALAWLSFVASALAQPRPFDDVEAQLRIKQAATAADAAARSSEALRRQIAAERQRVVQTDNERDLNQATLRQLEQELQAAEAKQRELEAALKAAQEARNRGLVDDAERRRTEEERRRQAMQPPAPTVAPPTPNPGAQQLEEFKRSAERGEAALQLDGAARQRLQVALTSLGFDTGGADGVLGPRSREMIAAWQKARGQSDTGFLTAAQQQALQREAAAAIARYEERQRPADPPKPPEDTARSIAIIDFDGDRSGAEIIATVRNDLATSPRLRQLPPSSYGHLKTNISAAPRFADWRGAGAAFVLIGQVTSVKADLYQLDYRLWDILAGQQIVGERLNYGPTVVRQQLGHIIADRLLRGATGQEGGFERRYCATPNVRCGSSN